MVDQKLKSRLEDGFNNYLPIIKNKGFDPCPVANNIPDFANSLLNPEVVGTSLYTEWWYEQFDRCENGYKTGGLTLPGPYYEYLNFSVIDGPRGPTTPYFVDLHYQLSDIICEVKRNHMPGVIIPKKRRAGISFFGVMMVNHGIRFIDRYRAGIAAGLDTWSEGFRLKLYRVYNSTAPEMRINHLIRADDQFKVGYEYRTAQGFQDKEFASVFFKTMKDKAEKFEGEYFHDVFLEESGQFPLCNEARESIDPAMKDGEAHIGTFYIYGTGGNMAKGSKQFKEIYHSADILGFVKLFIPGKRYYVPYVVRAENESNVPNIKSNTSYEPEQILGCEDIVAAQIAIDTEDAEYIKLPEKKSYIKHRQAYPNTVKDVFTSSGSNNFDAEKLYTQAYEIESTLPKYDTWWFDFVRDDKGDVVLPLKVTRNLPTTKTKDWQKVMILKDYGPLPDIKDLDVIGVDGYNEDQTQTSKSLGAIVGVRQYDKFKFLADAKKYNGPVPFLLYYSRPPRKEQFWEISLMISIWVNALKNTMISAESDAVIQFYKEHGATKYLAKRPKSFDAPNSKLMNDFGAKMTITSKPKMLGLLQSYIDFYIQYCWFIEMINDGIAYDEDNIGTDWDSMDALGLALMRIKDMNIKPQFSAPSTTPMTNIGLPRFDEDSDGNIYVLN